MKLATTIFLTVMSFIYLVLSVLTIAIDNIYWMLVSCLVTASNYVGLSLYDIYVMVFIILVPFIVLQCLLYVIVKSIINWRR